MGPKFDQTDQICPFVTLCVKIVNFGHAWIKKIDHFQRACINIVAHPVHCTRPICDAGSPLILWRTH